MAERMSAEDLSRLCHDLVLQVAYAFYDVPYLVIIKLLLHLEVRSERRLAEDCLLNPADLRRYMGTLYVHRLVKRYVNKEKVLITDFYRSKLANGSRQNGPEDLAARTRDVTYWYIDFREFANVVKYRLAMMRKGIDEQISKEVGQRGYICPLCHRTYTDLDIPSLFSFSHNAPLCEVDQSELLDRTVMTDPTLQQSGAQDKLQRFNDATEGIREALKRVEGHVLPSLNVVAWIARNVKTEPGEADGAGMDEQDHKFQVVLGGEERDQVEKDRVAEQQRVQNALPVWHTHSTVTGDATTLGLGTSGNTGSGSGAVVDSKGAISAEDELERHYAELQQASEQTDVDQRKPKVEPEPMVELEEEEEEMDETAMGTPVVSAGEKKMVSVGGVMKPLDDVTEEDEGNMTPAEYEAYAEAVG